MPAVAQVRSVAPLKDLYDIGQIPPLGHVRTVDERGSVLPGAPADPRERGFVVVHVWVRDHPGRQQISVHATRHGRRNAADVVQVTSEAVWQRPGYVSQRPAAPQGLTVYLRCLSWVGPAGRPWTTVRSGVEAPSRYNQHPA